MSTTKEDSLFMEQKMAINDAFISIEQQGTVSHESVMEQTKKKFPNLFQK